MEKLRFYKIDNNVRFEDKELHNAGYDLYALQPLTEDDRYLHLEPGEIRLIKTGIKLAIPEGFYGRIAERGSTGSKGFSVRAGVVDCNYRGEIIVALNNTTYKTISHDLYKAVAQIIIEKYDSPEIKELLKDDFDSLTTSRGDKGFGSTDKQ
jgi:dUTP pyrophosphatase